MVPVLENITVPQKSIQFDGIFCVVHETLRNLLLREVANPGRVVLSDFEQW